MRKGDDDDEDSEATLGLEQKGKHNIVSSPIKKRTTTAEEGVYDFNGPNIFFICLCGSHVNNIHREDKNWGQGVRRN